MVEEKVQGKPKIFKIGIFFLVLSVIFLVSGGCLSYLNFLQISGITDSGTLEQNASSTFDSEIKNSALLEVLSKKITSLSHFYECEIADASSRLIQGNGLYRRKKTTAEDLSNCLLFL